MSSSVCCGSGGIYLQWFSKKMDTFQFDVALLQTSITRKKKKPRKIHLFLICCLLTLEEPVHSTKASWCLASYHRSSAVLSSLLRLWNHLFMQSSLPEGSLSLHSWCTSTITQLFYSHAVPGTFSLLVQCLTSSLSSFQPSFLFCFLLSCGLLCVHCELTVQVVALIHVSWRPRLL